MAYFFNWLFLSFSVFFRSQLASFVAWLSRFALAALSSARLFFAGLFIYGLDAFFRFALVFFGVGLVTYSGVDYLINQGINYLNARFAEIPVELLNIVIFMGAKDFISILSAAIVANVALKSSATGAKMALNSGRGVWNAPRN